MTLQVGTQGLTYNSFPIAKDVNVNFPDGFMEITNNRSLVKIDGSELSATALNAGVGTGISFGAGFSYPWAFQCHFSVVGLLAKISIQVDYDAPISDSFIFYIWVAGGVPFFLSLFEDNQDSLALKVEVEEVPYNVLDTVNISGLFGSAEILNTKYNGDVTNTAFNPVNITFADPDQIWAALSIRYSTGNPVTGGFTPILPFSR